MESLKKWCAGLADYLQGLKATSFAEAAEGHLLCVGSEHWAYLIVETQDMCLESQDICLVETQDMCCVES